tara:strand:+ start:417 stop:605 length:189 start_codon:yes stop_codon:yes gene_type:complete
LEESELEGKVTAVTLVTTKALAATATAKPTTLEAERQAMASQRAPHLRPHWPTHPTPKACVD